MTTSKFGAYAIERPSDAAYLQAHGIGATGIPRADSVLRMEAEVGRHLSVTHTYHAWNETPIFGAEEKWAVDGGRIPLVGWKMGAKNSVAIWPQVAAGAQDSTIDAAADSAKALNGPVWLNPHWEPFPSQGKPADFVGAYRRIVDRFRARGVTNVKYLPILLSEDFAKGAPAPASQWYPGDDYADFVGADCYNMSHVPTHGVNWVTLAHAGLDNIRVFADSHKKTVVLGEWGCLTDTWTPNPGRRAAWFDQVRTHLATETDVEAVVYWAGKLGNGNWNGETGTDTAGHPNSWNPDFDSQSLAAFKTLAKALA
jgi:Glycosyl hydrolase family 26